MASPSFDPSCVVAAWRQQQQLCNCNAATLIAHTGHDDDDGSHYPTPQNEKKHSKFQSIFIRSLRRITGVRFCHTWNSASSSVHVRSESGHVLSKRVLTLNKIQISKINCKIKFILSGLNTGRLYFLKKYDKKQSFSPSCRNSPI